MKTKVDFGNFDENERRIIRDNAQKIYDLFKTLGNGEFDICCYEYDYGDAFEKLCSILPFLKNYSKEYRDCSEEETEQFYTKISDIVENSDINKYIPIKFEDWCKLNDCNDDDIAEWLADNSSYDDVVSYLKEKGMLGDFFAYVQQLEA